MNIHLSVAPNCIRCGRCVRVCPSQIFEQQAPQGDVSVVHPQTCIVCGHCAAVCPVGAVRHGNFPPETIHPIDRNILPTAEQVLLLCRARRSMRAFTQTPIPEERLEQILEAAHRAPTASNLQQVGFTLITDPERLHQVSAYTIGIFASVARRLENRLIRPILSRMMPQLYGYLPTFRRMEREFDRGNDPILRGATALLLIHTPKENRFGCQDANLAYQNGSLMAESLGVGQFYTGFVCSAIAQDNKKTLNRTLGIGGSVHAGMALGMPAVRFDNYIDKKPIRVTRF